MKLITREELKARLDRGDDFKLVNVLGDIAFRAKHIPSSLNLSTPQAFEEQLERDDEIVVYCASDACPASPLAYRILEDLGYTNVRRYAGGLADWEDAGLPVEGEMVSSGARRGGWIGFHAPAPG